MNPENNFGNENQFDSMNSATLGSVPVNNELNTAPMPEYNNQTSNLSSIGLENLSNNIMNNQQVEATPNVGMESFSPVENTVSDMNSVGVTPSYDTIPTQEVPQVDAYNSMAAQQPVVEPVSAPSEPVNNIYNTPAEPTIQNMGLNDVASANINVNTMQQEPTFNVPAPEPVPAEPTLSAPVMNEQNVGVEQPSGPTMPIPDSMPEVGYQAETSTPVDYATPMSNFDEIGTTPELDPKAKMPGNKKGGKVLVFLLIILLIGALGAGSYYFINVKHIFDKSSVKLNSITVEQGGTLSEDINDYATFSNMSSSNCILDISNIDIATAGTYDYSIKCGDKQYTSKVIVKDTTAPIAKIKSNVVQLDEIANLTAESFVDSCYDEECTPSLVNDINFTQKGVYPVKLNVTDSSSNEASIYAPLVVVEGGIHVGLLATKEIISNDEYSVVEKDVVLYSDNNFLSYTMYVFKFNNEVTYTSYLTTEDGGKVSIGDYSGIAVYDSKLNKITLVSDSVNNLIQGSYSSDMQALSNVGYTAEPFAKDRMSILEY